MREVAEWEDRRGFCRSPGTTSEASVCCCCFDQMDSSSSEVGTVMDVSSECWEEVSDHTEVEEAEAEEAREEL